MAEHGDWDPEATGRRCLEAAARAARDLQACGPRAVVLFGSVARLAAGAVPERPPRDLDLFLVGDTPPVAVEAGDYGVPLQLHRLRIRECVELARTLRYDPRPVALAKLYAHQVMRGEAVRVIAACLLLGSGYRAFGIQQIEVDGREDTRDYAAQRVLQGRRWWGRLQAFAQDRRGPWKRFSDRLVEEDRFTDPVG